MIKQKSIAFQISGNSAKVLQIEAIKQDTTPEYILYKALSAYADLLKLSDISHLQSSDITSKNVSQALVNQKFIEEKIKEGNTIYLEDVNNNLSEIHLALM